MLNPHDDTSFTVAREHHARDGDDDDDEIVGGVDADVVEGRLSAWAHARVAAIRCDASFG